MTYIDNDLGDYMVNRFSGNAPDGRGTSEFREYDMVWYRGRLAKIMSEEAYGFGSENIYIIRFEDNEETMCWESELRAKAQS